MPSLRCLAAAIAAASLAGSAAGAPTRGTAAQDDAEVVRTRNLKIPVRFARAADFSLALGGAVLDPRPQDVARPGVGFGGLVPDGIMSLHALNRDNSLIVRGTGEGVEELRHLLSLFDVPEQTVGVEATGAVALTDARGRRHEIALSGGGRALNDTPLQLRLERRGLQPAHRSGVTVAAHQLSVTPRLQADGTVRIDAVWNLRLAWVNGPGASPSAFDQRFATQDTAHAGQRVSVAHATYRVDGATVRVDLSVRASPAPAKGRSGAGAVP